jgi:hypothetical protein
VNIRFEFMLTLECHWGCKDCCRGLESSYPVDSHVTVDQAKRFIDHLKEQDIYVKRLKVNGGDPVHNPWFEEIVTLFADYVPTLFAQVKVQTAYPAKFLKAKYNLPSSVRIRSEPVDAKAYKGHHVPWFASPSDAGVIGPDDPPPQGTALTGKACPLQRRCGRSFERWGWMACAQEGTLGRMLGIRPHQTTYKHWGDPEICRHCPMSLGQDGAKALQARAIAGEIPWVGEKYDMKNLPIVYKTMTETHIPW